jgi:hypothetical protein
MAQKLKFGNGTWATKKGSTLAYNDEGGNFKPLPFTTTRNSIGTRVNKEGLIEVVGNDIPRIDYTDSADGALLLENSSTNLVTYSEDISQSVWQKNSVGSASAPIIASNFAVSPDGTQNATRVQFNISGSTSSDRSSLESVFALDGSSSYTLSFYIKSNTGVNQNLSVWLNSVYGNNITVTNEWVRVEQTFSSNSTFNRGFGLAASGNVQQSVNVLIFGFQLEQNSFSTSYIPTSGSTVQRAADTASGAGNDVVFNSQEGVVFLDTKALSNDGTTRTIGLSDGSNSNRIHFIYYSVTNGYSVNYRVSNSTQVAFTKVGNILDYQKIAFKYKSGDFSLWYNGFEIDTDNNTTMMSENTLDRLSFKQEPNSFNYTGKTKEIGYYDTILTDAELEYMTSYRSLNELVTELNLNTL